MASNPITLPQNLATAPAQPSTSKPAEVQVSATDILDEAHSLKPTNLRGVKQTIRDIEELRSFQLMKRRDYEQQLNKNRLNYGQWMRYAKWEIDHNHDFKRARSIMERALEVNAQHVPFWVRYIELELLHKNVNHARNLLNRAVTILPRTDKLWYIYCQTEEALGNYSGVRTVFERWLSWKPSREAWESYIAFEERYKEHDNARALLLRYVTEFEDGRAWKRWIVFETTQPAEDSQNARTRGVFEAAADNLLANHRESSENSERAENPEKSILPEIIGLWTAWEASVDESERARAIFNAVLSQQSLSKNDKYDILQLVADFDKNHGASGDTSYLQRKLRYEKQVSSDPRDHESWWEYAKLEERVHGARSAIPVLENAVKSPPTDSSKSTAWRRYVFLWIKLALYLEYQSADVEQARRTWTRALETIPHKEFTFAKLWVMYAEFELRQTDRLDQPRKILGRAIGQTCQERPKNKILRYYIDLEKRAGEWERVRRLYEKWLEVSYLYDTRTGQDTANLALQEYIDFEKSVGESGRCVALFTVGVTQISPGSETLFTDYIEFLKEEFRYDAAREAFRNRISQSDSATLWIMLALFESSILSPDQLATLQDSDSESIDFEIGEYHLKETRKVFEEAYKHFRDLDDGESARTIVESWEGYERDHGSESELSKVTARMPTPITKRRTVDGMEEVYQTYEFPKIAEARPGLSKFLANAKKWAATQSS